MRAPRAIIPLFLVGVFLSTARAQSPALTLDQALARARAQGPQILAARARIDEARGRLIGASILLQDNPLISGTVGPRYASTGNTTDYDISLTQPVELGGRRTARIAGANAAVQRETQSAREAARRLLRDVSISFTTALAAKERLALAEASRHIADDLFQSMQKRYDAGDVPILDVNIARHAAARARTEVQSAQAGYISALGDLRLFLGMTADDPLEVAGDLHAPQSYDLPALLAQTGSRPDLRVLEAERTEAQAEIRLGEGFRWPTVAPSFSFKRDQGDRVIQGGVAFDLPIFQRGQELQAVGQARTQRASQELEATRRAVSVEVRTAFDIYNLQAAAVHDLERDALPSLAENETLARRSFEEGEIGLAELLLVRRESFELRNLYTDRRLQAAIAGIELQFRAGVLQ